MKKFLIFSLIGIFTVLKSEAQFFQATYKIDDLSTPKKLSVFIKPNGGNISDIIWDRFEFFLRIPRTNDLPTWGTVVTNNVDFPGLTMAKGGLSNATFIDAYGAEPGKTTYYFCSTVPNAATNANRSFQNNMEYEVFSCQFTGNIADIEFVADQVNQIPYYLTLSRTAVPSDMTVSGPFAPGGAHAFYGGTTSKDGDVFILTSGQVLPVTFKGFYAIKQGDNAKLTWDVSGDEKNSYFQVQRSTDGRNFSNIQKVEALKNGRSDNSYETMDLNLSKLGSKEVYYQIAQFDQDGTKTMSPVRKLSVDGLGKAVVAYPNPTPANAKLVVDAPEAGKGQIILRDNLGRQVQNINAQFNKGINQFELQMSGLSNGDYKVTVQGAGLNETIKLQKIR